MTPDDVSLELPPVVGSPVVGSPVVGSPVVGSPEELLSALVGPAVVGPPVELPSEVLDVGSPVDVGAVVVVPGAVDVIGVVVVVVSVVVAPSSPQPRHTLAIIPNQFSFDPMAASSMVVPPMSTRTAARVPRPRAGDDPAVIHRAFRDVPPVSAAARRAHPVP
jgi:hypothetical protein